jgi:two-component system, chemotaxis family, chemotaxis protein CheY
MMVLDDSPHMQAILKTVIKGLGFRDVIDVRSSTDAFSAIRECRPNMAIVDVKLGEADPLNGIEFVKQLRTCQDSPNRFLPIIIFSAHADLKTVVACRNAGAMEFVAKPVSPATLYQRIVYIANNPRPFVKVSTYFGPCRRRKFDEEFEGEDRRGGGREAGMTSKTER